MIKHKIILIFGFVFLMCANFALANVNKVTRIVRKVSNKKLRVIESSEGRLAALIIPGEAYQQQGFHVPKEIPLGALLQTGVNIQPRGANSFRVKEGKTYKAHMHTPVENPRRELFIVKEGVAKLTFYSKKGKAIREKILHSGDVAFITQGHSVEYLTDSKVIEIKEGPYPGTPEEDKVWLEAKGRPKLDGLNFTGLATSITKNDEFMDPEKIFNLAVKNDFAGPIQVTMDNTAMDKIDRLKAVAEKNNIPLIAHSYLEIGGLSEEKLIEEMEAANTLLENQKEKRIVFHFQPHWGKDDVIEYIRKFNEHGLLPCLENPKPKAGYDTYDTYKKYISILKDLSKKDLEFDLVIDIDKFYTKGSSLKQEEAKDFLTQMLDIAKSNNKNVILHVIDSKGPERKNWVPVGKGEDPYEDIVEVVSNYDDIIYSTIFEYEDMENSRKANQNWLKMVRTELGKSKVFTPKGAFLGAVLTSGVNEFKPTDNIPIKIIQEDGAQIVKWKNNGYQMIHVKSGSMTLNLLIDGEIKQVNLNPGDTILLSPEVAY